MKTSIYSLIALAAGSLVFASCADQLDIEQKGVIAQSNFYKNDTDCEKALTTAYEYFCVQTMGRTTFGPGIYTPNKVMGNHAGDDVNYASQWGDHEFGGAVDEFRYLHNPEAPTCLYKGLYSSVSYCNILLDNYAENPATDFQKRAVAEARVLRAYDFFLLACYWGQPPFVDHVLAADALPANGEKTQKDYYLWVAEECEKALGNLDERKSTADKAGAARVTKGFANALIGKAYMFAGEYEKAKAALKKVIDSGKYALVPGDKYLDLFHLEGDLNEEKIFEMNIQYDAAVSDWSFGSGMGRVNHSTWMESNCFGWRTGDWKANPTQSYHGGLAGMGYWGSIGITEWFGPALYENDGDSYRRKATIINIEDVIFNESGIPNMEYQDANLKGKGRAELANSKDVGITNLNGMYGQTFWLPVKQLARKGDMVDEYGGDPAGNQRLNNIIVMRYAEVLLNYAECCIQTGDKGEALTYINMIQNRAGSKTISKEATMDVLKKEKAFELWFEGCRFQDILRWNDAEGKARLAKAGHEVPNLCDKLYRAPKAGETVKWQYGSESNSRFYLIYTHDALDNGYKVGFVEGVHNLFPYPEELLQQNPNLKPNPSNDYK